MSPSRLCSGQNESERRGGPHVAINHNSGVNLVRNLGVVDPGKKNIFSREISKKF